MNDVDIDLIALNHYRELYKLELDNDEITLGSLIRTWWLGRQIDRLLKRLTRKGS